MGFYIEKSELSRIERIKEQIEAVSNPRERRALVDSFYAELINSTAPDTIEDPFLITDAQKLIFEIMELGGNKYYPHRQRIADASDGFLFFEGEGLTYKEIAERYRNF